VSEATLLVECRALGFSYGGDVVLESLDLAIREGERLAILGPNGGGKTTLVRLILGLLAPGAGEIAWGRRRAVLRLAYVPQFPSFERGFPLRVEEMVLQGLLRERRLGHRFPREAHQRVAAIVEQLALTPLRHAYLSELSGGELKRALIARSLVGRPELLVLDEPAASLDEPSRGRLWRLIAELPAATTVLLVTHDLAPATFSPSRAVLVDRRIEELSVAGLHAHPLLCGHTHG